MNRDLSEPRQTIGNLKGEVDFRAKLAVQHVSGEVLLPDYYRKEEHDRILRDRVEATRQTMTELASRGIRLSPFLELGAERGQRALVLANDFGADGIAIDISYHQLRTMEHFAQLFQRARLPMRICCDANQLPFKSNSFPFTFCYGFLHHFPSLAPIIKEIHRVTADGYFYFDEEPFRRVAKLALYRQASKIYSPTTLRKNRWLSLIESFISEAPSDEVEHGIVENHTISLREWIAGLSVFQDLDIELLSLNRYKSKLAGRLRLRNIPNFLLGGIIAGLCRKAPLPAKQGFVELRHMLSCPDCMSRTTTNGLDEPALIESGSGFQCARCGVSYPCRDGVLFLFPPAKLQELYPAL